jgi:hypothetical protein
MADKTTTLFGGGFLNLLTLIFITLKLTGVIDWSWWLVISPFVANFVILILLLACIFILKLISK